MADLKRANGFPRHAIAIVGLAGRFPGARNLDEFWLNIRNGVESIETFSDAQLEEAGVERALRENPSYVRQGTTLQDADLFDASFFGVSPREAQVLDPQHRIFLECAWEALEHAGYGPGTGLPVTGVYAGTGMNTYLHSSIASDPALVASVGGYQLMLGNDKDFLSTRVSYKLDLHGPSLTVQTACSTSLVAVKVACGALEHAECDLALAGGVSIGFPQRGGYLYQEGMILSPDAHCRPFDIDARGTRPSAGCAIVVLKRLEDALADRDTIYAVILGAAVNNDGAGKAGYTAPSVDGQVEVIATAQMLAGVDPRTIDYIEAHGTGTPLGDPIEVAALTQVFRASTSDVGFCHLGSLKANLGHLDAAAGAASLIKTVLSLKHREIPPLVNFQKANPQLDLPRSPFVASAQARPWASTNGPRRAGVSSFGIGGTNAHVVVEEAPPAPVTPTTQEPHVLLISARSHSGLEQAAGNLAFHLRAAPHLRIGDVAWTLQVGRQAFAHRCAVVASDPARAAELLEQIADRSVMKGAHEGGPRPVAFLFSGQGSQHAGMGQGLYQTESTYRDVIDRCSALLEPHLHCDLRSLMYGPHDDAVIHETRFAQPALFATELALATLWRTWGVQPAAMLGHSIGEYVAAHLAGVMSLEDALAVVAARGRIMQAMPPGSMAAVHLGAAELERLLRADVEIAAVNGPALCTVSGSREGVTRMLNDLSIIGVETRLLHASHAFHSRMMEPALEEFLDVVGRVALAPPESVYVSNVTGTWITAEDATSPQYYAAHLRRSVRFAEGLRCLAENDALHLVEVGPGNALTTLARMNLGPDGARRVVASLGHPRDGRSDAESMLGAVGRLWVDGVSFDWSAVHAARHLRRVPLPTYPFERKRFWVNAAAANNNVASGQKRVLDVGEWLFAPTWSRDDGRFDGEALSGTWLVLGDGQRLSDSVADRIRERGSRVVHVERGTRFECVRADRYTVRAGVSEDIAEIVRVTRDEGGAVAGAILLWTAIDASFASLVDTYYHTPVALAAGMGATTVAPARIVLATAGAFSVLDEPVRNSGTNVALGPVLTLPAEVPGLSMRIVDLAPSTESLDDRASEILVAEAAARDAEPVVAHRAGRRWIRRFDRCVVPAPDPGRLPIKPGGVYLLTGGVGGLGLAIARRLSTHAQVRLLLTARTALPPRQDWDAWLGTHAADDRHCAAIRAIRDIEKAGSEVLVAAADAADLARMESAVVEATDRWGRIDGVIHAAGIAGEGRLAFLKSRQDVDDVLRPKMKGLEILVQILGDVSLDFVLLMSSIDAVVGAPGLADCGGANAVLDAFVESSQRPLAWRRVVALDWGTWRDVGMAARLLKAKPPPNVSRRMLDHTIEPSRGVEALERALVSGRNRLVVVPFDLNELISDVRADRSASSIAKARSSDERQSTSNTTGQRLGDLPVFDPPRTEVEERLSAIWTELLGVDRIGVHDDFFDLGGHSLVATRVLARVHETLGVRLALRDVFDAPTVRKLAERIAVTAPAAPADDREEIEF